VGETRQEWVMRMIETWNAGRFEDYLVWFDDEPDPSPLKGAAFSTGTGRWPRWAPELADSPVNACML
jgi:hypothetical protein